MQRSFTKHGHTVVNDKKETMTKNNFLPVMILLLVTVLPACKKYDINHHSDFEKSYQTWLRFKTDAQNSYKYQVTGGSWTGIGWVTDITVTGGIVTQRHYKLSLPASGWPVDIPEESLEWTENEGEIGTHEAGVPAITLDAVYDKARNDWLKKRDDATTYFEAKNSGMISLAGYIPDNCADDCFMGISIKSIEPLSPTTVPVDAG